MKAAAGRVIRAGRLQVAWVFANLGYSAVRIAVYSRLLAGTGLRLWQFAVVELTSSVIWSVSSGRLVSAIVSGRRRLRWALLAVAGFVAPDAFLMLAIDRRPKWLPIVLVGWGCVAAGFASRRLMRSVREHRVGHAPSGSPDPMIR